MIFVLLSNVLFPKNIAKCTTDPRYWALDLFNTLSLKQKLWNLGITSACFFLLKGKKYIEQLWQIHVTILTNPCNSLEKSKHQFWQIHVTTQRNTPNNFEKSMQQLGEIHLSILTNPFNNLEKSIFDKLWQIQQFEKNLIKALLAQWVTKRGNKWTWVRYK